MPNLSTLVPRRRDDPARLLPWLRDHNPIFARLGNDVTHTFLSLAVVRNEFRGTVLCEQDTLANQLFVVVEGNVVMRVQRNKLTRELFSYTPGDVAGLLALLDQRESPYELVASTNVQVLAIDARKLAQLTAAFHPAARSGPARRQAGPADDRLALGLG
jgi:CRP-like cAMP-binding protein